MVPFQSSYDFVSPDSEYPHKYGKIETNLKTSHFRINNIFIVVIEKIGIAASKGRLLLLSQQSS